jgi:hypothetical protein
MLRDSGIQYQYTSLLTYGCSNVCVSRGRSDFRRVAVDSPRCRYAFLEGLLEFAEWISGHQETVPFFQRQSASGQYVVRIANFPSYRRQRIPALTPHMGQATESACFVFRLRNFIRII